METKVNRKLLKRKCSIGRIRNLASRFCEKDIHCLYINSPLHNSFHECLLGSKDPHLPVTDEDIRKISSDISKEWKQIGRVLLLPNADSIVDSIDVDEKTVYEKSYKMLTKWKRKKVSNANYEALAAAFQDLTVERGDLIPKYC